MATNNEFITDALRILGVLQEGESPSAEQASDGLRVMNDLIADYAVDEVDLGYAPQSDVTADNGINIEDRQAVKYLLAIALAPHYQAPISQAVVAMATDGRARLLRNAVLRNQEEVAQTLHRGEGQGNWTDITTLT